MILVDYNQMIIANFMQFQKHFNVGEETNMLRHMILNNIKMLNKKLKEDWGELIFCCDGRNNWRKDTFKHYKANRKKARETNPQNINWPALFDALNCIKEELSSYFPYKVIDGNGCEADDIIAIICKHYHKHENILIVSSDKDFMQLHDYVNVSQWSPLKKKFIQCDSPTQFKNELIIKGDRSDGIPNILSPDDTFITKQRQRKLTKKNLNAWSQNPENVLTGEVYRNFKRNQQLIDFEYVPNSVEINILDTYKGEHFTGRSKMLNYFIMHRLKEMTEFLQDF